MSTARPAIRQWLSAADAVECREAAGDNVDYVLAVGRCLPVFAQRDERDVIPQPHLQIYEQQHNLDRICLFHPGPAQLHEDQLDLQPAEV